MLMTFVWATCSLILFFLGRVSGRASAQKLLVSKPSSIKETPPQLSPYRNAFDMIVDEYEKEMKQKYSERITPFEGSTAHCPECGQEWHYKLSFCSCEKYEFGHFHLACSNKNRKSEMQGCGVVWVMRSKGGNYAD